MSEDARAREAAEVAAVASHSTELKRELRLPDLVLTQVMFIVGAQWVGTAAMLGHAQIVYWLLAMALFYLPQAAVVIYLNRLMPLEGGLYQWAKIGFNDGMGFLVAWNLWVFALILLSSYGVVIADTFTYVLGPAGTHLAGNKWYDGAITGFVVAMIILVSLFGLRIGKWVHNAGGTAHLLTFGALVLMPIVAFAHGTMADHHPFAAAVPKANLISINIFSKLALGALTGFEYVAILAGETKNPARAIGRSVVIATPIIALMFILGTGAVLAATPAGKIDLIAPIPQALTYGLRSFGWAVYIVPVLTLLLLVRHTANVNLLFAGTARLPMVAGWDGLLPRWFTRLHPKYRTPLNSILFLGAVTLVFGALSLVGVGLQEAFQLLDNAAGILYAVCYLVMFALPIVGMKGFDRAPLWLRLAAGSGFAVSVLYIVFSVFPIIDVTSGWSFAVKIIVVVVGANVVGAALYRAAARRSSATATV
ncbi:MAG: APC family permease [Gemmatimonadota bacterium]|nr:APC family permease [Gemmatimonadota bacterium]MDE3174178.1 APC family permease [Gemmatimonadota bacterium]MDE3215270.1 APC family permease [Gemmatimonadota bacterium]